MTPTISATTKGFTLVELAIVLVVLGILLMLGLPSFAALLQNSQVRTAATSIEYGLQTARAEAVRLNAQVAFTLNGNSWSVDVVTPAKNVQARSGKEAAPKAVVASTLNPITFNGMGRLVPPANVTINVTDPTAGACLAQGGPVRCLNIAVLSAGQIRACDPQLVASDPEAC